MSNSEAKVVKFYIKRVETQRGSIGGDNSQASGVNFNAIPWSVDTTQFLHIMMY